MTITPQKYWNTIGSTKEFEDPLYLDKLSPYLNANSNIVEYGCGYGRLLKLLSQQGYEQLTGFDFSSSMIARGQKTYPRLDLRTLKEPNQIPLSNASVDVLIMSTVLCCMIDSQDKLIDEIDRVLKKKGVLYLADFLICDDVRYQEKYAKGFKKHRIWGVYTTTENLEVRHFSTAVILELLKNFNIQWFEQFDFKTMNQNPARTFHCIASKC